MNDDEYLTEIATRHQVMLERLKSGEWEALRQFLVEMERDLTERIRYFDPMSEMSLSQLQGTRLAVRQALERPISRMRDVWRDRLFAIAMSEAEFEIDALRQVIPTEVILTAPVPEQVAAAVFATPFAAASATGDGLLDSFFDGWERSSIEKIEGAISIGAAQGQTNAEIERTIRGTVALNRTDGTLEQIRRAGEAIVRTSVQHVSQVARQETWRANRDVIDRVRWVSTLDGRTTQQCRSLDGREFPIDRGPRPPIHVQCRSTTVAVLDERYQFLERGATRAARDTKDRRKINYVPASQTYYQWLQKQPRDFQVQALGETRAKLFRDGGISPERFAELNLSRRFEPLTLAEMRERNPAVFQRAGL